MKKLLFIILLVGIAAASKAQTSTAQNQTDANFKKWFVGVGLSTYLQTGGSFFGMGMNGGYYLNPRNRFSLDIGFHFHSKDVGSFSYRREGSSTIHYDGVIKRAYTVTPVLATWNYVLPLKEKFDLRVGPSIGLTTISASYKFDPIVDNTPDLDSESTSIFACGANAGLMWYFINNLYLDAEYRLLINSSKTFEDVEMKAIASQIKLGVGLRF